MFARTVLDHPHANHACAIPQQPRRPLRIPYFFSLKEHTLEEILERPYHLFLEVDGYDQLTSAIQTVFTDVPDFSLSLTTASAYQGHIAGLLAGHMNKRFGLESYKSMHIHTCLQEALINAIAHGNLGIDGQFNSLEKLDEHYALIAHRLRQEGYRRRRITVSAWNSHERLRICVSNEGNPFPATSPAMPGNAPCGRGLHLMRSLASAIWIGENRQSLFMTFDYGHGE